MAIYLALFTTITSPTSKTVKLRIGTAVPITHKGIINISNSIILNNVLCVPNFSFNLISASKLTKYLHCCLVFSHNRCHIQDISNWMTKVGE